MKKKLYRFYRHTMRRLARWFLGFWDCPKQYKRNWKQIAIDSVVGFFFGLLCGVCFCLFVLWSA